MSYCSLSEKTLYLKSLGIRANEDLQEVEIDYCEKYADTYIESCLTKTWEVGNVPDLIEQIACMLASCKAWEFIHTGQTPVKSDYAENLRSQAVELLKNIKDGTMGIKNQDGTWDEDYDGKKNAETGEGSIEFLV